MKLYTRKGDDGKTHLCSGPRVTKDDPHVEAYGTIDELNAHIGVVRAEPLAADVDEVLHRIQHELFAIGADLATPNAARKGQSMIDEKHVQQLEAEIDRFDSMVPPLNEFILPGGERSGALLHVARTVCRRAERRAVSLQLSEFGQDPHWAIIRYLNRLGDLFFVLPRVLNARGEVSDEQWKKETH